MTEHGRRVVDRRRFLQLTGIAGAVGVSAASIPLASRAAARLDAAARERPAAPFISLRPPATPLATRSMYLSGWLAGDQLPGTWPSFWNGHTTAITGLVRVDDVTYLWCGDPSESPQPATQLSLEVTATESVYMLQAGPVVLTARFFSPVDPASLRRQSVPMSYVTVTAASSDGGSHSVQVYADISAEWAHGNLTEPVSWQQQQIPDLNVITVTPGSPSPLTEYGDQAAWGTVVWATDDVPGLSWQTGQDVIVRGNAARGALPDSNDTQQPRAINDNWPVFGFLRDLGLVGPAPSAEMVLCLGHVRQPALSYLGTPLQPYWTTFWAGWPDMLGWFRQDLAAASQAGAALDAAVQRWAGQHPEMSAATAGQYAAVTRLALRQAFAGTELVVGPAGAPWAFLKEISSGGLVSTVDVIYPGFPAYLQLSPDYLKMLLAPVLDFAENHQAGIPWAPHDLGAHYPVAGAALSVIQMPVEESGNMLIMAAAVMARMTADDAAAYATAHYPVFHKWAAYLLVQEPDYPGTQDQTDDFTGVIAKSVNLNLKGIVGLGAFSQIAKHAGNDADQAAYASAARSGIATWSRLGQDQSEPHLDLAYDDPGTFSLDYNGYPDRLLDLNLVSAAVQTQQAATYLARASVYGVPLDSRHTYTKADWEMLTAAFLYANPAARDMLVEKLFSFLDTSPSRVPFTDWYDTVKGVQAGFQARPVVGGTFALNTLRYSPNGLVGYWAFGPGGGLDASGNGAHLTLVGGARPAAGGPGGSLALGPAGAHASAGHPVVRTDTSFTVAAWVRLDRPAGEHTVLSQGGRAADAFALRHESGQGRWAFAMTSADEAGRPVTEVLSRRSATAGSWVHLAGVHDAGAGQLRLFVDGIPQGTAAFRDAWAAWGAFHVGPGQSGGRPAGFFPGAVGEVRSYSRALSAAEVAALAGLPAAQLASFPVEEGYGPLTVDRVGGRPLRLDGARWGTGLSGPGLSFRRSAAAAGRLIATRGDFSVAAWVRLAGTSGRHVAVSQDGTAVSGFALEYSPDHGAWSFAVPAADSAAAPVARAAAPLPPRTGDWQHLIGVRDTAAGELRLYVDGRLAAAAGLPGSVAGYPNRAGAGWDAAGSFVLGRGLSGGPAGWFDGGIDQVRTWHRALSGPDASVLV